MENSKVIKSDLKYLCLDIYTKCYMKFFWLVINAVIKIVIWCVQSQVIQTFGLITSVENLKSSCCGRKKRSFKSDLMWSYFRILTTRFLIIKFFVKLSCSFFSAFLLLLLALAALGQLFQERMKRNRWKGRNETSMKDDMVECARTFRPWVIQIVLVFIKVFILENSSIINFCQAWTVLDNSSHYNTLQNTSFW